MSCTLNINNKEPSITIISTTEYDSLLKKTLKKENEELDKKLGEKRKILCTILEMLEQFKNSSSVSPKKDSIFIKYY
jgi:predicted house-cleaning noncanonical NTP pyrophosphatase (MazG superfamily)